MNCECLPPKLLHVSTGINLQYKAMKCILDCVVSGHQSSSFTPVLLTDHN